MYNQTRKQLRGEEADEFMAPNGAWEIEGEPYVLAPVFFAVPIGVIQEIGR
jgi:hypothetical protein